MKKKLLSIVLALAMSSSMLPLSAMAASTAMLSPETQQMVSFSSRFSFFRMTARISGST